MNTDAHPTPDPGAYWPPGFRERADAQAATLIERDLARSKCSCSCHDDVRLIAKAALAAVASVAATALLLVALVGCTPATTRALCDTSEVVLDVSHPESAGGKLAASVGRFVRSLFCARASINPKPQGAPHE